MLKVFRQKFQIIFIVLCLVASGCSVRQPKLYSSKNEAVKQLKTAIEKDDKKLAAEVLGPQSEFFFDTGDAELDKFRSKLFLDKFAEFHDIRESENNQYELLIGKKRWPFPAPLTEKNGSWYFDSEQGVQALQDRIIGSNELSAISVLETIYHAQQDFRNSDLDQNGSADYAKKIVSSDKKKDGLYWPEDPQSSPLAGFFVKATEEGYQFQGADKPQPYRGYYFKILESDKDSFTALAYPAAWAKSGYMSFIINEKSWIYEKNLSEDFDLSELKLDQSWGRIQ